MIEKAQKPVVAELVEPKPKNLLGSCWPSLWFGGS